MSDMNNRPPRGNGDGNRGGNYRNGGNGERKFGEKRSFGGNGERNSDRKPYAGGNKPAFRGEKPAFGGDKPRFDRENRPPRGDKPSFGDRKPAFGGDKPSFGDRKPAFGGDRERKFGDKPGFGGNRGGNRPGFGGPRGNGRPMGGHKPVQGKIVKPHQQEGLASRRLALEVIREVTENGKFIHLVMDEKLRNCTLPLIDRRLAARLAYDTVENQMYLDHALNQIMARPDCDIKLRNVLRLGACQLLLEDRIPESAACNTAVALCKETGMEGLAGVCNGVLRNLIRQKEELTWPDPAENPVKALSVRHSVPEWLVEKLLSDWGDEAISLMSVHSHDSYITVRPNLTRMDDETFEALLNAKVWEHEPGKVAHSWRIRNMAEIAHDAGFVGGKFSIQSESSMMAAMAVEPKRGMQILDCCAAPGGKSCLMAEMMGGSGRVQAWELHPHRADLITAQMKRLGLENIRPMTRDASIHRPDLDGTMDAVLLDAPCSGLGVMADKPDVKYRVTPESVAEIVQTQRKLLDAVAPYVKRGGTLVYSTCSVLKEENVRQVEAFLARHPEFELAKLPESIPAEFRQHEDVGLQLLPSRDGVEGFYICRMKRKLRSL